MKPLKILFITLLLGSFAIKSTAQQFTSNNLSSFVGTWEYRTATEYFQIILQNGNYDMVGTNVSCLTGGYYYEKNGVVVANYLTPIFSIVNDNNYKQIKIIGTSFALTGQPKNATAITILFIDDGKGQKGSGMGSCLTLINSVCARWVLTEAEGMYAVNKNTGEFMGNPPPPLGFSVPTNVILNKVIPPPPDPPTPPGPPNRGEPGQQIY